MDDKAEPIKSVDEAREYAAQIDANPCIPQAMHYAFSQLGPMDFVRYALGREDNHIKDAMSSHLNDADYNLMHAKDLASVDPSLSEKDRGEIEQIRKATAHRMLESAHLFDDAAMPPAPQSCGRGR